MSERTITPIINKFGKLCGVVYPNKNRWFAFCKTSNISMSTEVTAIKWIGAKSKGEPLTDEDLRKGLPEDIYNEVINANLL